MVNEELSINILKGIMSVFTELEVDMQKQLKVKRVLDEVINKYKITSKCTEITTSDIMEKVKMYLITKKLENYSKTTLKNKAYFFNDFAKFFNKPISTITTVDIRMYIAKISNNAKQTTINNKISNIKSFFTWLQDEGYIINNPAKKIKQVKIPKRLKKPLTEEEIEIIRDINLNTRDRFIFELLLSSGIRVSELVNLKIEDIDMNNKRITIVGKGNKERVVKFNVKTKILMEKYLKERKGKSEYLIISNKMPFNNISSRAIQKIVKKIGVNANIHLHPHKHRTTFATNSVNRGCSLESVQALLGHESINTTISSYVLVNLSRIEKEYEKL